MMNRTPSYWLPIADYVEKESGIKNTPEDDVAEIKRLMKFSLLTHPVLTIRDNLYLNTPQIRKAAIEDRDFMNLLVSDGFTLVRALDKGKIVSLAERRDMIATNDKSAQNTLYNNHESFRNIFMKDDDLVRLENRIAGAMDATDSYRTFTDNFMKDLAAESGKNPELSPEIEKFSKICQEMMAGNGGHIRASMVARDNLLNIVSSMNLSSSREQELHKFLERVRVANDLCSPIYALQYAPLFSPNNNRYQPEVRRKILGNRSPRPEILAVPHQESKTFTIESRLFSHGNIGLLTCDHIKALRIAPEFRDFCDLREGRKPLEQGETIVRNYVREIERHIKDVIRDDHMNTRENLSISIRQYAESAFATVEMGARTAKKTTSKLGLPINIAYSVFYGGAGDIVKIQGAVSLAEKGLQQAVHAAASIKNKIKDSSTATFEKFNAEDPENIKRMEQLHVHVNPAHKYYDSSFNAVRTV